MVVLDVWIVLTEILFHLSAGEGSNAAEMLEKNQQPDEPEEKSIHSGHIEEIHNVPMSILMRPIPSVLDEQKVQSLMETIKVRADGNLENFTRFLVASFLRSFAWSGR